MFISVKDLELRKIQFDTGFDEESLGLSDERLRLDGVVRASGQAELANSLGEIRVAGRLTGKLDCDCDRCLEPVRLDVAADFDLVYCPDLETASGEEIEITADEADVAFYAGEGFELVDVVREQILLSLPLQRLCSPGCKGLCPACGQNRNVMDCQCRPAPTDERWAALKEFSTGD